VFERDWGITSLNDGDARLLKDSSAALRMTDGEKGGAQDGTPH